MENKEAIKILRKIKRKTDVTFRTEEQKKAVDIAVEALKRSEPIKPIIKSYGVCCGKCNSYLLSKVEVNYPQPQMYRKYCPSCGQRVDYSSIEKDGEQDAVD